MKKIILTFCVLFSCELFAQPVITSFNPATGPVGTVVTFSGTGFSTNINNNIVYFGAVKGTVTGATATSLTAIVPPGTSYQAITVTTSGLTAYSRKPFIVTFPGGGAITNNSFATRLDINTSPITAVSTNLRDLNTDGKADIVMSSYRPTGGPLLTYAAIYKNGSSAGSISLAVPDTFSCSGFSYYTETGDMDGDGKSDIVTPFYTFKNVGSGGNIALAAPVNIPVNYGYGVVVADFDLDGLPDYAITNNDGSGKMGVLRNTSFGGIISYATKIDYTTGVYPRGITYGFINADNKPDIIVANQLSQSVSVFINNSTPGNISFSPKVDFTMPANSYPESIAVGDFDGDDKPDLAVAGNNDASVGTVSLFRNTGTGASVSFAPRVDLTTGLNWYPYLVVAGDIDGDGKPDIAVTNQSNAAISVFRNNSSVGAFSFNPKVDFIAPSHERGVLSISDVDGDGKPEIIAAGPDVNYIFRNTIEVPSITSFTPLDACGGSTVTITGTNFTGSTAVSFGGVAASSFNVISNTTISAVIGAGATGNVAVTNSYGTGIKSGFTYSGPCIFPPRITTFNPQFGPPGTPVTIKGSNFSPVAANNVVYFGSVKGNVSSSTDTSITVAVPAGATNRPLTVTTNNLTAYSSKSFNLTFSGGDVCETFTNNSFYSKQDFATGTSPYFTILSDIDGDGKIDAGVVNTATNNVSLIRNNSAPGTIAFASHIDSASGVQPIGIFSGDFDGDGKQDMATVNYSSNTVSVFRNTSSSGALSYASRIDFSTGLNPRGIYIQDIDLDGKPDIVVTNFGSNTVSVLRNTSLGTGVISFAAQVVFTTGNGPTGIFAADADGDNKVDLVVTNAQSNTFSFLKNISSGSGNIAFNARTDFVTGIQPSGIFVHDMNADGKPEILVSNNSSSTVSVFTNTTSGVSLSLSAKTDYNTGSGPFNIFVADLNGDNKPDIATSNVFDGTISILRNTSLSGTVLFDNAVDIPAGSNPRGIAAGDIDGDGRPDLVCSNTNDNTFSVFRNRIGFVPGQVCAGGNTVLVSNLTGTAYQWQLDNGAGFMNISDNGNYSGTNNKTLVLNGVQGSWYGYKFRCVADGSYSDTTNISIVNKWIGTVDTTWENPANWSCYQLPDANTDVLIDCLHSVTVSSNAFCRSLNLKNGTTVLVKPGFILTVTH